MSRGSGVRIHPARKAKIAEEMATVQPKLDAAIEGPYVTPGGVLKHVSRRDATLREATEKAGRTIPEMTPGMAYMAVLDDLAMVTKVLAKVGKEGFPGQAAKDFAKYTDRLMVTAGQHGVDIAKSEKARELFELASGLLSAARQGGPSALAKKNALEYAEQAAKLLDSQLDDLLKKVSGKKSAAAVRSMQLALRESMILGRTQAREEE